MKLQKFVNVLVLVAMVLALIMPATVAAAAPVCPVIPGVTWVESGFGTYAHFSATNSFKVPDGTTVSYREDLVGIGKRYQPGETVPITDEDGPKGTIHGCVASGLDAGKSGPKDPGVCVPIEGATFSQAYDNAGKPEKAVWVDSTKEYVVPQGYVADVHGGRRYLGGDTVPANVRFTLWGCVLASYGSGATTISDPVVADFWSNLSPAEQDALLKFMHEFIEKYKAMNP